MIDLPLIGRARRSRGPAGQPVVPASFLRSEQTSLLVTAESRRRMWVSGDGFDHPAAGGTFGRYDDPSDAAHVLSRSAGVWAWDNDAGIPAWVFDGARVGGYVRNSRGAFRHIHATGEGNIFLYLKSGADGTTPFLLDSCRGSSSNVGFTLYVTAANKLALYFSNGAAGGQVVASTSLLTTDGFVKYRIHLDGAMVTMWRVVDGVEVNDGSGAIPVALSSSDAADDLYVGAKGNFGTANKYSGAWRAIGITPTVDVSPETLTRWLAWEPLPLYDSLDTYSRVSGDPLPHQCGASYYQDLTDGARCWQDAVGGSASGDGDPIGVAEHISSFAPGVDIDLKRNLVEVANRPTFRGAAGAEFTGSEQLGLVAGWMGDPSGSDQGAAHHLMLVFSWEGGASEVLTVCGRTGAESRVEIVGPDAQNLPAGYVQIVAKDTGNRSVRRMYHDEDNVGVLEFVRDGTDWMLQVNGDPPVLIDQTEAPGFTGLFRMSLLGCAEFRGRILAAAYWQQPLPEGVAIRCRRALVASLAAVNSAQVYSAWAGRHPWYDETTLLARKGFNGFTGSYPGHISGGVLRADNSFVLAAKDAEDTHSGSGDARMIEGVFTDFSKGGGVVGLASSVIRSGLSLGVGVSEFGTDQFAWVAKDTTGAFLVRNDNGAGWVSFDVNTPPGFPAGTWGASGKLIKAGAKYYGPAYVRKTAMSYSAICLVWNDLDDLANPDSFFTVVDGDTWVLETPRPDGPNYDPEEPTLQVDDGGGFWWAVRNDNLSTDDSGQVLIAGPYDNPDDVAQADFRAPIYMKSMASFAVEGAAGEVVFAGRIMPDNDDDWHTGVWRSTDGGGTFGSYTVLVPWAYRMNLERSEYAFPLWNAAMLAAGKVAIFFAGEDGTGTSGIVELRVTIRPLSDF